MSGISIGLIVAIVIACAFVVLLQFKITTMRGKYSGLVLPVTVIIVFAISLLCNGNSMLQTGMIFPIFIVAHFLSFSMLLIYLLKKKEN